MARYNEILVGRLNRSFQKMLSMKGEPPAPQLSTEIQPVIALPLGAEFRYLESWNRYGSFSSFGAVALQNTGIAFRNPSTSGVIAVVEKLVMQVTVATVAGVNIAMVTTAANYANLSANARRLDARQIGNSPIVISTDNNVALGGNAYNIYHLDTANRDYEIILHEHQEITVLPGDRLTMVTGDVNTGFAVNFVWRERNLEESEAS